MSKEERSLDFLKFIVKQIFEAMKEAEMVVAKEFPALKTRLPDKIHFVHSEELEEMYPELTPRQRETEITRKHGAVFLIGIGHPLKSGKPHDLRAADYDDWVTDTSPTTKGLDGDIIVWDSVRQDSLELSSMGIRVDAKALEKQLEMSGLSHRKSLEFHKGVLEDKIPLSVGGGIGQSRLCMFLLQKAHIGEVQSSVWPKIVAEEFERRKVPLL